MPSKRDVILFSFVTITVWWLVEVILAMAQ